MKKFLSFILLLPLAALSFAQQQQQPAAQQPTQPRPQQQAAPAPPKLKVKVGDRAPDFTLNDINGHPVKLSDFRGKKNVVLAFYILAFTGG